MGLFGSTISESNSSVTTSTTTNTTTIADAFNNALNTTQNFQNIGGVTIPSDSGSGSSLGTILILAAVGVGAYFIFRK